MFSYREQTPMALKDEHGKGRNKQGATKCCGAQLPGSLTLPGAGELPAHDNDNPYRGQDIEDLEEYIPGVSLAKEVGISGTEDDGIENLCYHGDT